MRMILGPVSGELDAEALLEAYPWPDHGPWLRAMMATTLDGSAAGPDGLSGSISGDEDRLVFDSVRRLADAVLVGAGTLRQERYGAMKAKDEDAAAREANGQRRAPALAIVSGSLDLPWTEPVFTESTERPVIFTAEHPDPMALARAREVADVVTSPSRNIEPGDILDALHARGLVRVVCEGGPTLLEGFAKNGLLDEADISLSPMFVGNATSPRTPGLDDAVRLHLQHVITAGGFLMNRYLKVAQE